jgi:hypothetical protein
MADAEWSTPPEIPGSDVMDGRGGVRPPVTPWYYFVAFGLSVGGLTASIALRSLYGVGAVFALFVLGLSVFEAKYRALTGLDRGENQPLRLLVLGLTGVALCVGAVVGSGASLGGAPGVLVAAVVASVVATALGPHLDAAIRSELRHEP